MGCESSSRPQIIAGRSSRVDAQIRFQLMGQTTPFAGDETQRRYVREKARREPFPDLEVWSRHVRKADFGPEGAFCELPFRRTQPERDLFLKPHALLTATIGVAGVGSFSASDDLFELRAYSSFRDYHQLETGRRYHRREFTRLYGP